MCKWANFMPILGFLAGLSVASMGAIYIPEIFSSFRAINKYDPGADPIIGSQVSLPNRDSLNRPIPSSGKTLVIFTGACSYCSLYHLDLKQIPWNDFSSVILIPMAKLSGTNRAFLNAGFNERLICDAPGFLYDKMNVKWSPRWLTLDSKHRLVKIQKDVGDNPWHFIK